MIKKEWGKPLVTKLDILMTEGWWDNFEGWLGIHYPGYNTTTQAKVGIWFLTTKEVLGQLFIKEWVRPSQNFFIDVPMASRLALSWLVAKGVEDKLC